MYFSEGGFMKYAFLSVCSKHIRFIHLFILLILLTLNIGSACGGGTTSSSSSGTSGTDGTTGSGGTTGSDDGSGSGGNDSTDSSSDSSEVVSRTETSGSISYKIYLQNTANASNRKGIILLGSGNDQNDPSTGSLSGGLENNVANELAELGYIAAIVAYQDEPPVNWSDGGVSWNSNCEMLATDMSDVANTIISTYGSGLTRAKVLTGGVSYASYALLTNVSESSTLIDTRGVLATCGSTGAWNAQHVQVPVYTLNCSGNPEGDYSGSSLIDLILDATVKADSGYDVDSGCSTHCGGSTTTWTTHIIDQVQVWLP